MVKRDFSTRENRDNSLMTRNETLRLPAVRPERVDGLRRLRYQLAVNGYIEQDDF
jgi:hypothetical protein